MATSKKGRAKKAGKGRAAKASPAKGGAKKSAAEGGAKKGGAKKGGAKSPPQSVQRQPVSPLPAQHQAKPGIEAEMTPRPEYEAPLYRGADKLRGKVALITGAA
ncbi:MAG: hypothetical protein LC800_15800 [Acidobacteria bacterium]|nr:hypothetical protein [Acidobacteriota bacterium]